MVRMLICGEINQEGLVGFLCLGWHGSSLVRLSDRSVASSYSFVLWWYTSVFFHYMDFLSWQVANMWRLISRDILVQPVCVLCSNAHEFISIYFLSARLLLGFGIASMAVPSVSSNIFDLYYQLVLVALWTTRNLCYLGVEVSQSSNHWRERNVCIFKNTLMSQEAVFKVIDLGMRDRLLSMPSMYASSAFPSLLELYFW